MSKAELPVVTSVTEDFLCVRCSRHMRTCCQTSEVYASPADVRRISEFTGQADFTEFRVPEDPVYLEHDNDPLWHQYVYRSDGTRRILRRRSDGSCMFLGELGCVLPLETRPLVCRIYPFDYDATGLRERLARGCPTELLRPDQSLLDALDIQRSDAERWHKQLYEEIPCEQDST